MEYRHRKLTVSITVALLWATSAALGVTPEDKCESAKSSQ